MTALNSLNLNRNIDFDSVAVQTKRNTNCMEFVLKACARDISECDINCRLTGWKKLIERFVTGADTRKKVDRHKTNEAVFRRVVETRSFPNVLKTRRPIGRVWRHNSPVVYSKTVNGTDTDGGGSYWELKRKAERRGKSPPTVFRTIKPKERLNFYVWQRRRRQSRGVDG